MAPHYWVSSTTSVATEQHRERHTEHHATHTLHKFMGFVHFLQHFISSAEVAKSWINVTYVHQWIMMKPHWLPANVICASYIANSETLIWVGAEYRSRAGWPDSQQLHFVHHQQQHSHEEEKAVRKMIIESTQVTQQLMYSSSSLSPPPSPSSGVILPTAVL